MVCQNEIDSAMKRRVIYGVVTLALTVNLLVGARIYFSSAQAAEKDSAYPSLELFSFVMEKVRKDYVDGQKLTYQELVYGALKGMLNTLDPHSEFMEPDKYKELQNDTQGAFGGLGIVISMKDNYVTVIAPMEDTPGFRAGIMSGDRIVKIDGKSTEKLSLQDAVKTLRGDPGTDVKITIFRPSSGQMKEFKLTRAVINIDMVKDINSKKEFPLGENKIGYVRLVQFGEKTSDDLEAALKKLKAQGMTALVLDLRWNPGGLLEQAVDVCEKFLRAASWWSRPKAASRPEFHPPGRRSGRRVAQAAYGRARQPGQRQRLRNCRRLPAGLEAGYHPWREDVRQRLRAKHHAPRGWLSFAPDHRQILHPQPQSHSRGRHHAGHRRPYHR